MSTEFGMNYKIKAGDSLYKIAKKFKSPSWLSIYNHPKNIKFKNKYPDPEKIKAGEVIWVPSPSFIQIKTGNSYNGFKPAMRYTDPTGLASILVVTNGTIMPKITPKLTPGNYYRAKNEVMNSKLFTQDVGKLWNRDTAVFMGWNGKNEIEDRSEAIQAISKFIMKTYSTDDDIILMGHSHGGNVMVEVADILIANGHSPDKINVLALDSPVRPEYQSNNPQIVTQTYSLKDWVQTLGNKDTSLFVKQLFMEGRIIFPGGRHIFNGSNNIDITSSAKEFFKNNTAPKGPCKWHQVTRAYKFIEGLGLQF